MTDYEHPIEREGRRTPRPGLILALGMGAALGLGLGFHGFKGEKARDGCIPLGFSEIHQIEKDNDTTYHFRAENDGKYGGEGLGSRTYYYAGLNDLSMKVFECWNEANKGSKDPKDVSKKFAQNLGERFNPGERKHHYELKELYPMVAESCDELAKNLGDMASAKKKIALATDYLHKAWRVEHHDNDHVALHTDGDGNIHTTIVYDNTTHRFFYDKGTGESASKSLDEITKMPDIRLKDKILMASKTNEEGERAATETRQEGKDKIEISKQGLKDIANKWHNGSTLAANEGRIYSAWAKLPQLSAQWQTAKGSARNAEYKTGSHSDPGPQEYQTAQACITTCNDFEQGSSEVLGSLDKTRQLVGELRAKSDEFIQKANKGEECKEKADEVMKLTKEVYQTNFKGGFDLQRFRNWVVGLWALGGALGGALAGAGLGKLFGRKEEEFKRFE